MSQNPLVPLLTPDYWASPQSFSFRDSITSKFPGDADVASWVPQFER